MARQFVSIKSPIFASQDYWFSLRHTLFWWKDAKSPWRPVSPTISCTPSPILRMILHSLYRCKQTVVLSLHQYCSGSSNISAIGCDPLRRFFLCAADRCWWDSCSTLFDSDVVNVCAHPANVTSVAAHKPIFIVLRKIFSLILPLTFLLILFLFHHSLTKHN